MRKLFLISILLLASTSVHAEENKGDWIADAKTGCKVWNPVPASDESITWLGTCKDGKGDGKGSLDWYKNSELQSTITGVMQDGRCVQECSVKTKGGDSYVGEMKDNLPHGKGKIIRADGGKYEGEIKDGERHGKGTFVAKDGSLQEELWEAYGKLPAAVQELVDKNFELLKDDPCHPSLHLKRIEELWSVRVGTAISRPRH
ncbi:MAG: MORN repeat-containing protein [Candidatus Electronema aureum]|uniref:MORN repeat-containing protein n=1 Tax=Candidatus Electronema aureum TaxID=2005002 RepID=A0A521FYH1_9BACT|nr:MAG: MORN repeat-containing protein [Candidatus Electronema aureum]